MQNSESKKRDPYFDNLKFILMILVVSGHFFFENRQHQLSHALLNFIYAFHMPVFIYIAGYFSKNIHSQRGTDVLHILFPLLIARILTILFTHLTGLGMSSLALFKPGYHFWYLLCLFLWRLVIPYFSMTRPRPALIITFLLAFWAGFMDDVSDILSFHRFLYFLPIFVLGYYTGSIKEILNRWMPYKSILISVWLAICTSIALITYFEPELGSKFSYAFIPKYNFLGQISNFYVRIAGMLFFLISGFLFLFVIPDRKTWYTKYGERTMQVYLMHMFLVWPMSILFPYIPWLSELCYLAEGFLIVWLLSTDWATRILDFIVHPDYLKFIFKKL